MTRRTLFALCFCALIGLTPALAQTTAPSVSIDFPFVAGGRVFDAGTYAVATTADGHVVLTPEKGGAAADLTPLKTMNKKKGARTELVFDTVGSMRFLTEAWLPEAGGFKLGKTGESMERRVVKSEKVK